MMQARIPRSSLAGCGLAILLLLAFACSLRAQFEATSIFWDSRPNAVNRTSTDALMDDGFSFRLGVFAGTFVPSLANITQWEQNWRTADQTAYAPQPAARYADSVLVASNADPYTLGKATYVWGFRDSATSSEWILFRRTNWTWPDALGPPTFLTWSAEDANQVILGQMNTSGSPFLMKSASVRSYAQWQAGELAGEPLNAAGDDPDQDGVTNLLEFAFGTLPKSANAPVLTPVTLQAGSAQITIPRRIDHLANYTVEVSGDLVTWNSGPAHTQIIQNDATALVVRDLTPLSPLNPKRFMRFRVSLP